MLDRYFFTITMHAGDSTAHFQCLHHLFDTLITELHLLFCSCRIEFTVATDSHQ